MVNNNLHVKGYSLLELIIVIGVIILFSGLLLTEYGKFIEQARLKTEVKKIQQFLELARKMTNSREKRSTCDSPFGYGINIQTSSYNVVFCCNGVCDGTGVNLINSSTFPSGTITVTQGTGSFQFVPTSGGTNLPNDLDIILKNTTIQSANKCLVLHIKQLGIITMDDFFSVCP